MDEDSRSPLKRYIRFVSGIYLSISLVSSVLAFALWDFTAHSQGENALYFGGLLCSFALNIGICLTLVRAIDTQASRLFLPYIVCSSIHLVISVTLTTIFAISGVHTWTNGGEPLEFFGAGVFLVCSGFWWWSLSIVKLYRQHCQKCCGEHVLFENPEDV